MQSRNENRASPNPAGVPPLNTSMYPFSLGGHAYAPLPKGDELSQALAGFNITGYHPGTGGKMSVPGMNPAMVHVPVSGAQAPGQFIYACGNRFLPVNSGTPPDAYSHGGGTPGMVAASPYMPSPGFHTSHGMPNGSAVAWTNAPQNPADPPDLAVARRNSFSSNEETGPHTPFFVHGAADYQPKINTDNSPQAWATPSPQQLAHMYYPQISAKPSSYMLQDLDAICLQEPAIPRPIPAIFSGEKGRGTLESSLMNKLNTTNVYIRGLHPDTTDEMLWAYGSRFGTIDSAKSMMDQQTGTCKGFGFIKYHNFTDGSNCIRGFYHWGYEAKWARVSHNEKLKNLGDRNNTNLYISGIPTDVDFNEHSLMSIFGEHKCLSSKILRDANGLSRGVGFARFESPEECAKIIDEYNNKAIGQDGNPISVRFADTADQKKLKIETQQRRQFKTHEYNVAAFGPHSPYHQMSPLAAAYSSPMQHVRSPVASPQWPSPGNMSPYWQAPSGLVQAFTPPVVQNGVSAFKTPAGSENAAPARSNVRVRIESPTEHHEKLESPSAVALAKRSVPSSNIQSPVRNTDKVASVAGTPRSLPYADMKNSPVKSIRSSPSKQSPSKVSLVNL